MAKSFIVQPQKQPCDVKTAAKHTPVLRMKPKAKKKKPQKNNINRIVIQQIASNRSVNDDIEIDNGEHQENSSGMSPKLNRLRSTLRAHFIHTLTACSSQSSEQSTEKILSPHMQSKVRKRPNKMQSSTTQ